MPTRSRRRCRTPRSAPSRRDTSRGGRRPSGARRRSRRAPPRTRSPSSSGRGRSPHQVGHSSPASRTISARTAAYSRSAAARIRSGVSASERIVWRIFRAKRSRAEPALAVARGQDRRRAGASRTRRSRAARRPPPARSRGVTAATAGSSAALVGLAERVVDELGDAGELVDGRLRVEPRDGSPVRADERGSRAVEERRDALEASGERRQPVGERREVAGDQREQAAAEEVDPARAGPRRPREARSRRTGAASSSPEHEVPVDGLVGASGRSAPRARAPSGPRTRGAPRGRPSVASGHVAVEPVVADRRRADRVEAEVLVEEPRERGIEAGHAE